MNNNLTIEESDDLHNATSEAEWNAVCDRVKDARDGRYPEDWYARVVLSGLGQRKAAQFARLAHTAGGDV